MAHLVKKLYSLQFCLLMVFSVNLFPQSSGANYLKTGTTPEVAHTLRHASEDERLPAESWRDWPVIPTLSDKARAILEAAVNEHHLDPHAFSKVGDCQFTTETFLAGYVKGVYTAPDGLQETTHYFKESMARDSITSAIGLGINSVLNPMFGRSAGYIQCSAKETPLDCELRTRKPAIVLIAMGTNWKPFMEITFEEKLREVVDTILASGALPVLATKADNIETDWKLNLAIAKVAYDYDLPLVNVWKAVQPLPNHGLSAPVNEYLTGEGWMARNDAWIKTLEVIRVDFDPKN
jgi:hypothetical protein